MSPGLLLNSKYTEGIKFIIFNWLYCCCFENYNNAADHKQLM